MPHGQNKYIRQPDEQRRRGRNLNRNNPGNNFVRDCGSPCGKAYRTGFSDLCYWCTPGIVHANKSEYHTINSVIKKIKGNSRDVCLMADYMYNINSRGKCNGLS